jgi:hypothetical protein
MRERQTSYPTLPQRIHAWILEHDDSKLFMVLYIGLAVVLSIAIGLFWLVVVVAVHFGFELIRQRNQHKNWLRVFAEAFWELKLDIALVLFAFVISLYMDIVLGAAGLGGASRLGAAAARSGARFAAWQRIIRGVLLTVDDAAQVVRAVSVARKGKDKDSLAEDITQPETAPSFSLWGSWRGQWGRGDWVAIVLGAVFIALLALTPLLTEHTYSSALAVLADELHPFPFILVE